MSRIASGVVAVLCGATFLVGCGGATAPGGPVADARPAAATDAPPTAGAVPPYRSGLLPPVVPTRGARLADQVSPPVVPPGLLSVPAIGVSGPITGVGVDGSGELAVPPDAGALSWYGLGPAPGAAGSAVVAGHVDYDGKRGVFWDLRRAAVGDTVDVAYVDGSMRAFRIESVRELPKADLPTAELFATTGRPRLVLITCGGSFDRSARSYVANIVVTAVPA